MNISNKISFIFVSILSFICTIYVYQNTLGDSFKIKQEYEELVSVSQSETNYAEALSETSIKLKELDELIIPKTMNIGKVQQVLMEQIEKIKDTNNIHITKVPSPHQYKENKYTIITEIFELEGSFVNLLKVFNLLERNFKQARLSSLHFKLKENPKKNKLFATVYFQNIKKND